jgi:hypothetical protein
MEQLSRGLRMSAVGRESSIFVLENNDSVC